MAPVVVLISANAEWRVVRAMYPGVAIRQTPFGECFSIVLEGRDVIFLHGGWGKIAAAASTQYAISTWSPEVVMNLGTCGGFDGLPPGTIARGDILLVERTLVYDIIEQMTDPEAALRHYAVTLDLSWLRQPYPQPVRRGLLLSADRDILPDDIPLLVQRWGAAAADWESGAIAWVAARNHARALILRGVSDLVGVDGGEAYGAVEIFQDGARRVMEPMLQALPGWLRCIRPPV